MTQNFSDPIFLEALKAKEPKAVEAIVSAYTSHIYRAAFGQGFSEEMAQEVSHNTWLTFFEIVDKFEGRSHIRTFLFGIFYNKCSELRRTNLKFAKTDPIEDLMESKFADDGQWRKPDVDPVTFLENIQTIDIVKACLEKLPDLQKAVFSMKVVEELEPDEICNALDISATNLRQLLFRGKNRIRECVTRKSGDDSLGSVS